MQRQQIQQAAITGMHRLISVSSQLLLVATLGSLVCWLILVGGEARRIGVGMVLIALAIFLLPATCPQWLSQMLGVDPDTYAARWFSFAVAFVAGALIFLCIG